MAPASLAIDKASLPRSVRGIDQAHLRRAIRRKQNSESARRCRARRRQARLLATATTTAASSTTPSGTTSLPMSPMQMPSTPPTPQHQSQWESQSHPLPLPPQDRIIQLEHLVRTLSHQLAMAQAQCATLLTMRDPKSVQAPVSIPSQVQVKSAQPINVLFESDVQEREEFLAAIDQLAEL